MFPRRGRGSKNNNVIIESVDLGTVILSSFYAAMKTINSRSYVCTQK